MKTHRNASITAFLRNAVLCASAATNLLAAQIDWSATTGDFSVGANWSGGTFPGTADQGSIANGRTSTMTGNPPNALSDLWIGNTTAGTFNQNAGTLGINNTLVIGHLAGANGTFNFTNGIINNGRASSGGTIIGDSTGASGTVNMSGTASYNSPGAEVWLSTANGAHGEWNLSGGSVVVSNWTAVGRGGDDGLLNITGGTWSNTAFNVTISSYSGNKGKINVSGNGTLFSQNDFYVGESGAGTLTLGGSGSISVNQLQIGVNGTAAGAVYQAGGAMTVRAAAGTTALMIGRAPGSYGYYSLSGGSMSFNEVGVASSGGGNGLLEVSGGTFIPSTWLTIARSSNQTAVIHVSGGSLNAPSGSANAITMNWFGGDSSIITLSGTAMVDTANGNNARAFNMVNAAGSTGIVNLAGGNLIANSFTANAGGLSLINFNGGKVTAAPSTAAPATFLQGVTAVRIYQGGAIIDNNSQNIVVPQPLLAPSGYGVATINIASPGAGYIAPPILQISGGSGTGATAIAMISPAGLVTNIQVTCPGSDYQAGDAITVTLSGGGSSSQAAIGPVSLTANTGGGLAKDGPGTLTLSATNTYTGVTSVSNGTLKIGANASIYSSAGIKVSSNGVFDASAIGGWTVLSNCSIGGSGIVSNNVTVAGGGIIGNETNNTGTLTIQGSMTVSNNIVCNWNYTNQSSTSALVNVTGTLTLPSAGTINLPHNIYASRDSGALFQFNTLSAGDFKGWKLTVDGTYYPNGIALYTTGNTVYWRVNKGTLLLIR